MNSITYLTSLLTYLVFIPAAVLCYLPMRSRLRLGVRRTVLSGALLFLSAVPVLSFLETHFALGYNVLMIPALICLYFLYQLSLKAPMYKTFSIFIMICTLFSFLANIANGFDAYLHPQRTIEEFSLAAAVFQLILCVFFCVLAAWPLYHYANWLIENFDLQATWFLTILISAIFLFSNLLMYPRKYETLHVNNVGNVFWGFLFILMLLYILLCIFFYRIVNGMVDYSRTRERNHTLEMMESQYVRQQRYIQDTAAARHDFRHAIGVLDELLSSGDMNAARDFLKEYHKGLPRNDIVRYCTNPPLNALLNYYAQMAHQDNIRLKYSIQLPDQLPLTDVDICSITANILENAVAASREIPQEERMIRLTMSSPNDVRFAILAVNNFNGKAKQTGTRYLSTRRGGSGIGLTSIESIAERYGGTVSFHHENREFTSGIVIPMQSSN